MPSSVGSALLAFGAILTTLTVVGGVIFAALGLAWELSLLYLQGRS